MGEDRTSEPQANHARLTVAQAAVALGVTEGAVRSRIKRGTLPTAKEGGRVFVLLGGSTSAANQPPHTGVPGGQAELVEALQDQIRYLREQLDAESEARTEERRRQDTIIAQLSQANVEQARTIRELEPAPDASNPADYLEHEETLREEAGMETRTDEQRQRWHEHRHGAPRESPQTVEEEPEGSEPRPYAGGPQEAVQRPQGGTLRSLGNLRRRLLGW